VAAAAVNRASALANFQPSTEESYVDSQPGTPPQEASSPKPPPALPTSQSVLAAVETAHTTLTPSRQERQAPALHRSVSAENSNAFSALREGIAGLNIGKNVSGMLTNLGGRNASPASNSRVTSRTEQELREMT